MCGDKAFTHHFFFPMCVCCYKNVKGSAFVEFNKREHALKALKAKVASNDPNLYCYLMYHSSISSYVILTSWLNILRLHMLKRAFEHVCLKITCPSSARRR